MTPEQRAALERVRKLWGTTEIEFDDLLLCVDIALSDYPADDECEMTRQELIRSIKLHEETFRDIRSYIRWPRIERLPELIAETLDNLTWLVSETDWETLDAKYYQALREITKLRTG